MRHSMKVSVMAFTAMFAFITVAEAQTDPKVWPWDFPMDIEIDAKPGQQILSNQEHYLDFIDRGEELVGKTMLWYNTTIIEVGKEKSIVDQYDNKVEVPNALIIPLGKSEKAKKGDILLTYGSSKRDMQRAIVIDDSTPTEPVVCYLDDDYTWPREFDSPKLAEKQKGVKLEPGSFNVLKEGKFESGAQVAFNVNGNMKYGTVVQVSGDKVLISAFASHLECTTKDNCKLLPFKEKFKVGDKVSAIDVSSYKPGYTVVNVDKEHGHLWVKNDDNGKTYVYSLFGVMK